VRAGDGYLVGPKPPFDGIIVTAAPRRAAATHRPAQAWRSPRRARRCLGAESGVYENAGRPIASCGGAAVHFVPMTGRVQEEN